MDEMSMRLGNIEDRLSILELEGRYPKAFDSGDGPGWAALFTSDGVYQSREATPEEGLYVAGREALADFCTNASFDGIHLLNLPQIDLAGDEARGRTHFQFVGSWHTDDHRTMSMVGHYDVDYRRVDGRWLMARRVTSEMSRVDRKDGPYRS